MVKLIIDYWTDYLEWSNLQKYIFENICGSVATHVDRKLLDTNFIKNTLLCETWKVLKYINLMNTIKLGLPSRKLHVFHIFSKN